MDRTENKIHGKVLVLGVDDRSALTVVRSLGRKGLRVHLGKDVPASICERSRYVQKVIQFPNSGSEPDKWVARLVEILKNEVYDLVIPTADNYLVLAVRHRDRLEKHARFAIPDDAGFAATYDKSNTLALAKSLDVPCPETLEISVKADMETVFQQFSFPLFIKPVSSKVWQKERRYNLKPEFIKDRERFEKVVPALLEICPVLVQSYYPGIGVGIELLTESGKPLAVFQHERVHEPLSGGGSSYRKSVKVDEKLLKYSTDLLAAVNWTGVAMVEFKYNPATGESVLMEINGRFWGSLPLAVSAGVDFPWLLYDLLVNGQTPGDLQPKENRYCRNPVKDLDWLKENIRADRSDPYTLTLPLWKVAAEIKNVLLGRESLDTIVLDDPRPGIIQLYAYILENFSGAYDKLYKAFVTFNYRFNPLRKRRDQQRIHKLLRKNNQINFVCKGNIFRSPFAYFYLNSLQEKDQSLNYELDSYGLIERVNRPSPENSLAAAATFGIDMTDHRSKLLSDDVVASSGILFVMDIELYRRVLARHPHSKKKMFYLGAYLNGEAPSVEILDPYGASVEATTRTFTLVSRAVDNLVKLEKDKAS